MAYDNLKTELINEDKADLISQKLSAINNNVRFSILEILRDFHKFNRKEDKSFKKDPLYSREINNMLLNNYNINITPQMLGQHLKKLMEADLIEEIIIKKEVPNKVGLREVKAYVLKENAFDELLLDVKFLSDELFCFFNLFEGNQRNVDDDCCVLTVFNGVDKGKTFKAGRNETVLIGRKADYDIEDVGLFSILLDNSYSTVSKIDKPHLKLFYKDGFWCVLDESSSNGTFIQDSKIRQGIPVQLKNNSFIKLSKGRGSAIIYCSF